jgi:hypothetical protein
MLNSRDDWRNWPEATGYGNATKSAALWVHDRNGNSSAGPHLTRSERTSSHGGPARSPSVVDRCGQIRTLPDHRSYSAKRDAARYSLLARKKGVLRRRGSRSCPARCGLRLGL